MNSKICLIVIAFIGLAFLSMPVKAESGTITLTNETSFTASRHPNNIFVTTNYSTWLFDNTNYTTITNMTLDPGTTGSIDFHNQSNVTNFVITSGGTGHGVASYSKVLHRMNWVFSPDTVITSHVFNITYDYNIFTNEIGTTLLAQHVTEVITNNYPICVMAGGSNYPDCVNAINGGADITYSGIIGSRATQNYTVSYPFAGYFRIDVLKNITSPNANTTDIVHSQTNNSLSYFSDGAANNDNFSQVLEQHDGIFLNVTFPSGVHTDVLINATGSTINPDQGLAGTNQTVITKPSSGANIAFDKTSYIVGDNVNVSWYLSDSVQNDFLNKKLRLTLNGVPVNTGSLDCGGCIPITSQQGFYIYQSTTPGLLQADVLEGIIQYTSVGSGSVTINPPGGSWIAIANTTMNTRTLNNVTYHVGYSVANYPAAAIEMDINDVSNGNLIDVLFPTVFPDGTMTFGQVHPIPVGNFSIRLIDSVKNQVLDTKYFTAIPLPQGIPTLGITTSSITTDKSTYFYGDFMQVNYQVDDTNFSNYNYTIMAHVISLDFGNITTKMIITPFADQVGTFTSLVNIDKTMRCDKGLNCWFNTGNNSINLVLTNNTAAITIAYANFTVSATTVDGYGLQTSTTTPTTGVQFTVTTTVPAGHNGTLVLANAGTVKSIFVDNRTVGSGITTFPETIQVVNTANVAYYVADLYGDDGILKVRIPLTVSQVATGIPGGWTKREDVIAPTCSVYDNWVGLMFPQGVNDTSRFAFALVWVVAILFLTTVTTKNIGIGISFAFLPYAFFLYLSLSTPCGTYMPTWTGVFIALIIGIKLRWF